MIRYEPCDLQHAHPQRATRHSALPEPFRVIQLK